MTTTPIAAPTDLDEAPHAFKRWPSDLGKPPDPLENFLRYRAQSILTVAGAAGPMLPIEQARDVLAWHDAHVRRACARPSLLARLTFRQTATTSVAA